MNSQHTAGPWLYLLERQEVEKDFVLLFHTVRAGDKNIVRVASEADARLIAAAPDMLEALESARDTILYLKKYVTNQGLSAEDDAAEEIENIERVIKSATGESIDGQSEEVRG